jgi:hypothetical protein
MIDDNVKTFRELCEAHDMLYTWSDDGSVYRRGEAQYADIVKFSKTIPRNLAVQVWNQTVEKRLRQDMWEDYKWK